MMEATKRGGDRQELHEVIRQHSVAAAKQVKEHGKPNDLLERITKDPAFAKVKDSIGEISDPKHYIGLAASQTKTFLDEEVKPVLKKHKGWLGLKGKVSV
jgi:adenylosuccinate lyase